MTTTRDLRLDTLALGSNCHQCGATTDEPCRTRRTGRPTNPHAARLDRAVRQYHERQRMSRDDCADLIERAAMAAASRVAGA
jgi:hypothetical protein